MSKRKNKYTADAAPEHSFYVSDGSVYKNYLELLAGLKAMHADTFKYHCNEEKNDFMNWARDVFGDKRLAKDIAACKTKNTMARKVSARIKSLKVR